MESTQSQHRRSVNFSLDQPAISTLYSGVPTKVPPEPASLNSKGTIPIPAINSAITSSGTSAAVPNGQTPSNENEKTADKVANGVETPESSGINQTIKILLEQHIVENGKLLHESWSNLDKIADYCEANYMQSDRKDVAFEETKNYTTRALASVANQIHNYASNLLSLFDLQMSSLNELETRANSLSSAIRFTEERRYRRDIGKLTKPKLLPNPTPKVLKPLYPEKYVAKKRRTNYYSSSYGSGGGRQDSVGSGSGGGGSIDFSVLDDIGEAHRLKERKAFLGARGKGHASGGGLYGTGGALLINGAFPGGGAGGSVPAPPGAISAASGQASGVGCLAGERNWLPTVKSATLRPSKSSNLASLYPSSSQGQAAVDPTGQGRTPAPTVRPPTPPLGATLNRFSSLSRGAVGPAGGKDYRSLGLMVAPPQLPNNYQAANQQQPTAATAPSKKQKEKAQAQPPSAAPAVKSLEPKSVNLTPVEPAISEKPRSPSTNPFLDDDGKLAETELTPTDSSWIPATYLSKVMALYDYNADKDDELTFKENSIIYVTAKNDDGWWEGVMNGITGLFPGNYVEPIKKA